MDDHAAERSGEPARAPKPRVAAIDGWFTEGDEPALVAQQCTSCGAKVFPPVAIRCPNPSCSGTELIECLLSRRGRVWSYTTNHYPPPAPFVAPEPFEPYSVAAVELEQERMIVLGQLTSDVEMSSLRIGDEVELTVGTLFEDEDHIYTVWKWKRGQVQPS